jgi:xanthine dehydrogenase accessory factor
MTLLALFRGGGDLASGAALRLARAGIQVVITELPQPMAVRRLVSFAQAIYTGEIEIEGQRARRVEGMDAVQQVWQRGEIAVLIDPPAAISVRLRPQILVDGRMIKRPPEPEMHMAGFTVGLGPGFTAGVDCHAVIETKRGPYLGRVYYEGSAEPDSGQPETVLGHQGDRVLRAPRAGILQNAVDIGEQVELGQPVTAVDGQIIRAPFRGLLRGLLMDGLRVTPGDKIGDLDPRDDPRLIHLVSDKALAIGGGVLEAVLSRPELRSQLGQP